LNRALTNISEDNAAAPSGSTASFNLQIDPAKSFDLWIRSKDAPLAVTPEAYVAATLLPAMKAGADLILDEPLDPIFAENVSTIQDIFTTWYPELHRVQIRADLASTESRGSDSGKTAAFFTGGVDSFYTLLKHEDEIDTLIYVHGFDVAIEDKPLRQQVSEMLHQVGNFFNKEVLEIETNMRDFSNLQAHWGQYHGAALATIALCLQDRIDHIHIPSSLSYNNLKPWGSSPLLDPLWSTEALTITHDGCEADRLAKCGVVAKSRTALSHLRVCWENRNNAYNCGRCEKCLRTMVQLLAAGGLERCTTFEQPLDPARLREVPKVWDKAYHYTPARDALDEKGIAPDVIQAIDAALQGPGVLQRVYRRTYKQARWVYHRINDWLGS